jgi:hypothetical protein
MVIVSPARLVIRQTRGPSGPSGAADAGSSTIVQGADIQFSGL